jgi:hypothetical protein
MDGISPYLFPGLFLSCLAVCAALALHRIWNFDELPDLSRLNDSPEEKYVAMGRLFSTRDLEFLRSQPGYTPQLEAGFRRRRAQVFRQYLHSMQCDFAAIHAAARMMAAQGLASPGLSGRLVQLPLVFRRTVWSARWQVFLYEHGWSAPAFSLQPAVDAMFKLRAEIDLAAVASAA